MPAATYHRIPLMCCCENSKHIEGVNQLFSLVETMSLQVGFWSLLLKSSTNGAG